MQNPELIIVPVMFGVIFGIFYLFITARNKERLALIEKGAEASIFYGRSSRVTPIWKVIVINLATLMMGIGLGIFTAGILMTLGMDDDIAGPGAGFFMAGAGLLTGFFITKKMTEKNE